VGFVRLTYLLTWLTEPKHPEKGAKHGSWGFKVELHIRVNIKELLTVHIKEVYRVLINHITRLIQHFTVSKQKPSESLGGLSHQHWEIQTEMTPP